MCMWNRCRRCKAEFFSRLCMITDSLNSNMAICDVLNHRLLHRENLNFRRFMYCIFVVIY